MSAPTWDQYMAPSLQFLLDGEIRRNREIIQAASHTLNLTEEQRQITIPSGQEQWVNRGGWALSYLTRAAQSSARVVLTTESPTSVASY